MPSITQPTPRELLERLTINALKSRIRELNNDGHSISLTAPRKSIYVNRILNALHPPTNTQLPVLPASTVTKIDTETALASTITITSEVTKARAASHVSNLTALKTEIASTFDQNKENWRAQKAHAAKGFKDAQALEDKFIVPVTNAITALTNRIAKYELEIKLEQQREQRELEATTIQLAREKLEERVIELYCNDDIEAARELEATLDSNGIEHATRESIARTSTPTPPKVQGVATTFPIRWKLVDISKLPANFKKEIADTTAIGSTVDKLGLESIALFNGAVEVWQDATTRSTGR